MKFAYGYAIIDLYYNLARKIMALSYNKLWKLLIDKGMTKTQMRLKADISTTTLAKLGKNETVSMEVLLRICKVLDCNVGDIMDVINEEAGDGDK